MTWGSILPYLMCLMDKSVDIAISNDGCGVESSKFDVMLIVSARPSGVGGVSACVDLDVSPSNWYNMQSGARDGLIIMSPACLELLHGLIFIHITSLQAGGLVDAAARRKYLHYWDTTWQQAGLRYGRFNPTVLNEEESVTPLCKSGPIFMPSPMSDES